MTRTFFIYGFIFLTLISCKKQAVESKEAVQNSGLIEVTKAQFKAQNMQLGHPEITIFQEEVKTTGTIDVPPQNKAKVTSFVGGYIKSTRLLVGDVVKKGQVLVTLENTDYIDLQKDYLELAEQIGYLESEYKRQKTLFGEKISSEKNYLKAQSDYLRTKAMYQGLKDKLRMLHLNISDIEKGKFSSEIKIYSPIDGNISVMKANVGQFIAPADVILEIVDPHHLHLELAVFEKDILKIKEGQKIKFKVPEASNDHFDANVHLVGKSIENENRTINVHGHLDESIQQRLLTGMFVEANIGIGSKQALSIGKEAVVTEEGKNYMYSLVKTTQQSYWFKKIGVQKGKENEQWVSLEFTRGCSVQSNILVKGGYDLVPN
ncbi:MAG: efflux transporter periplasmic adaptor subunit [Flavobacterium sp. BFFFF2]|nr:MAG: efflux transporter periplasmic adaptor subunit [Flavobacterium sp. BFFFF2]